MTTLPHRLLAPRLVLALLLCAVATAAVPQQQPAAPAEPAAPPATPAATTPPAAEAAPPATPPKPAPKAPAGTSSPARFEPTDKVRADFDVSFPIDI